MHQERPQGLAAAAGRTSPARGSARVWRGHPGRHDVVDGYGDGTYQPQVTLDRGQMAVFIARAMAGDDQSIPDPTGDPSFPDVPADFWSYRHIEYIAAEEIAGGYYDGLYHPENLVSRDQMAVFICRAFGLPM